MNKELIVNRNSIKIEESVEYQPDCNDFNEKISDCFQPLFKCIFEESKLISNSLEQVVRISDDLLIESSNKMIDLLTCSDRNTIKSINTTELNDNLLVMSQVSNEFVLISTNDATIKVDNQAILNQLKASLKPKLTILLKGLQRSGKSTLINTLFNEQMTLVSGYKPSYCQVVLTQTDDAMRSTSKSINSEINQLNSEISSKIVNNQFVNRLSSLIASVDKVRLVDETNYCVVDEEVDMCFVDTAGFGNEFTDKANHKWFQSNTIFSDLILLTTDRDHCFNSLIESNLLVNTLLDIESASKIGKQIAIVIVINKVDEFDEVVNGQIVSKCKENCDKIISSMKRKIDVCIYYTFTSALSAFFYRKFIDSKSFDNMHISDISRLCEFELGLSTDQQDNYDELSSKLVDRIQTKSNYKLGIKFLVDVIVKQIFNKRYICCCIIESLTIRLNIIKATFQSKRCRSMTYLDDLLVFDYIHSYRNFIRLFHRVVNDLMNESTSNCIDLIRRVVYLRNESKEFYLIDVIPAIGKCNVSTIESLFDMQVFLTVLLSKFSYCDSSISSFSSNQLTNNYLSIKLSNETTEPTNNSTNCTTNDTSSDLTNSTTYCTTNSSTYYTISDSLLDDDTTNNQISFTTSFHLPNVNLLVKDEVNRCISDVIIEIILSKWNLPNKYIYESKLRQVDRLIDSLDFTISIIQLVEIKHLLGSLLIDLIIRLLNHLSKKQWLLNVKVYGYFIVLFEERVMSSIAKICEDQIAISLAKLFVIKKISYHENILGYTMGLNELIQSNNNQYIKYKLLFLPIVYKSIPKYDYHWINYYNVNDIVKGNNKGQSALSYNDILFNHPVFYSERLLLYDMMNRFD